MLRSRKVEPFTADEKWVLLDNLFSELGLVRQHLDSYNHFIKIGLQQVVDEEKIIQPDDPNGMWVELDQITLGEPAIKEADGSTTPVWPMDARTRNLTYAAMLHLKMTPRYPEEKQTLLNTHVPRKMNAVSTTTVYVGHLPIMLRSDKCRLAMNSPDAAVMIQHGEDPQDSGGYFIVNGSERVLVTQEDLAPNRILVEKLKNKAATSLAKVFSTMKGFRAPVTLERTRDGSLRVSFPSVSRKISLIVLLRALGLEKDGVIARRIASTPDIQSRLLPILQAETVRNQEQALDYIGKRVAVGQTKEYRVNRTEQVLDRYLLPHLGNTKEARIKKAYFLCLMAQRVLELEVGDRAPDDKDHYASKRLNLAGDLLLLLFRNAFRSLTRDIKYQLERNANKKGAFLKTAVRADVITERLRHALATGNWVGGKAGVSQLLDRTNYMSTLSHLRRVVSPLSRSQPHFEARDLHPTHWGKVCVVPDTLVLLDDGFTQLPIREIEDNYNATKVMTIDKDSHIEIESSLVDFQRISSYDLGKRVFEIQTITGRKIRATEDHPFLTERGWVEVDNLQLNDRLLVRPTLENIVNEEEEDIISVILDENTFLNGSWKDILSPEVQSRLENYKDELIKLDLLPLIDDSPKLSIITRLFGAIVTDGSVSNTVEFYLGSEEDAEKINKDIELLGFSTNPAKLKETQLMKSDRTTNYKTFVVNKGGAFMGLMIALGIPIGRRTTQKALFPDWIFTTSKIAKREFLGGYMGGDGAVPWAYKRSGRKDSFKISLPDIEIHKAPEYVDSQIKYFNKLKLLFDEFEVKINRIYTKVKSDDRTAVYISFEKSKHNIQSLIERIGFRYCKEKQFKSQLILEFLRYRLQEINKRELHRKLVLEQYNQGISPKQIAENLDMRYRVVTSIIHRISETPTRVHPKSSWSVGQFFEETRASVDTGTLFVPIQTITEVDENIVLDFTTEENTHSFVANGFVTHNCPNETPEGPNCGLVKNLALQAYISTQIESTFVLQELLDLGLIQEDVSPDPKYSRVFLNGTLVGYYPNGEMLSYKIRNGRRNRIFAPEVNVAFYDKTNEVLINSDQGRVRRPLIIVKDGIPSLTKDHVEQVKVGDKRWSDLTRQGIIEYLDAEEEENSYIAINIEGLNRDHTHLEISAATILGICASLIPFPEHNRSDRNVYESGMAKQSLGIFAANFRLRLDTRSHILHYPQAPLVKTHAMASIGFDSRPAGQNFIVAVLSYNGYNMEDSLIMNRSSVERGLGRSTFFRTYDSEERRYPGGQEDVFSIPTEDVRGFKAPDAYRHLAEDGVVEPETFVNGKTGEVIIGRTSPPRFLETQQEFDHPMEHRRETSTNMRFGESGIVDTVIFTETQEGHRLIKVKMRSLRIPELGDKFASRHGQKGILGVLIKQEDMPFTENGLSPDLIINPHAIPSRMTIGQLMELLAGKLASVSGDFIRATAFEGVSADYIKDGLHDLGFQRYGREVMYDGRTGEKLLSDVFVGVAYYQKLHHLVNDKIHARARGPVQILTRQPTEGRSREGGLKFGEMERDCLIGHGTALILKERLLDESDKSEALFCEKCGFLAQYNRRLEKLQCPVCREDTQVSKIIISYAFKLLIQELMSLGIAPRIELENKM